jgi:hypothetical protein
VQLSPLLSLGPPLFLSSQPQLDAAGVKLKAGLVEVGHVLHDAAEKSRPALEKAGTAIKTTAIHVAEQAKPAVDKVGILCVLERS